MGIQVQLFLKYEEKLLCTLYSMYTLNSTCGYMMNLTKGLAIALTDSALLCRSDQVVGKDCID